METSEELKGKEFQDDMSELKELLEKEGFDFSFYRHERASPEMKELVGYYPTGEWHIKVGRQSIIKGYASFGLYEIYDGREGDPERFETAEGCLEEIKKRELK